MALITDMRHFLNENGHLHEALPKPAVGLALFQASIVAWVSMCSTLRGYQRTNVLCRRRAARTPCWGEVIAVLDPSSDTIDWHCPACGDDGFIRHWEGTPWDRRTPAA
jgi:hypothetical protein